VCTLIFLLFCTFFENSTFSFLSLFYLCSSYPSKVPDALVQSLSWLALIVLWKISLITGFLCFIACWVLACKNTPFWTMIALMFYSRQGKLNVKSQSASSTVFCSVDYSEFLEDYPMICVMGATHQDHCWCKSIAFWLWVSSLRNNLCSFHFLDDIICSSDDWLIYENFIDNWYCSSYILFISVWFEICILSVQFCQMIPFWCLLIWCFQLQIWYFIILNCYCLYWKFYCHTWNIFSRQLK